MTVEALPTSLRNFLLLPRVLLTKFSCSVLTSCSRIVTLTDRVIHYRPITQSYRTDLLHSLNTQTFYTDLLHRPNSHRVATDGVISFII